MALILDNDLICIERGARSYKWTGAELKSQVIGLAPVGNITGTAPIVVTSTGNSINISITDATTGQKGATVLTNTVDQTETKALTPKGADDALALKANTDGSNATGTWNINITGTSPGSDNAVNATNAANVRVDTDSDSNTTEYLTFTDGGGGSNRRLQVDGNLYYNPATNTLTTVTFNGNLSGVASSATTAVNATNATNSTNSVNVDILSDSTNSNRYVTFVDNVSGNRRVRADAGIIYNPSTNTLTTTTFVGSLSGNATSSNSATNATNAQNVNITPDSANATRYITFASGTSGNRSTFVDGGLTYNPSSNTLTSGTFVGSFSGTATNSTNADLINVDGSGSNANYQVLFVSNGGQNYQRPYIDSQSNTFTYNPSSNRLTVPNFTATSSITCSGDIIAAGDITAFTSSDVNLKKNIKPIVAPVEKVNSISGNTFTWKGGVKGDDTGVIAQEIEELGLPGITSVRPDGTKAVRYEKLVPLLIEAVKELSARVEQLETK